MVRRRVGLRPDVFGALATHAGDALFECCYLPGFPGSIRALHQEYEGSFARFFEEHRRRPALSKPSDISLLGDWAMSASYSPNEDGSVELLYDVATGRLRGEVWARWLEKDPVRMVARYAEALRSLRGIYIDCGKRDDYYIDLGATAFKAALADVGVTDVYFELFDATHSAIEYRYVISLEYLANRIG